MSVLALLIALIAQLFSSAQAVTGMGNMHMDADAQARALFDRMAIDFAQMVKRADVDYFFKDSTNPQPGNDQLAFFSQVLGYYPDTGAQSPISLVAYRVNTESTSSYFNKLQRLGYGLLWSGVAADDSNTPGNTPVVFLPLKIAAKWKRATDMEADDNYELAGPQVFRMEYYYILKGQTLSNGTTFASQLSGTPWDKRIQGIPGIPDHTSANGLQDVAAIGVVIAVTDAKSRLLISDSQLTALRDAMNDFSETATKAPGDLETQWQRAIDDSGLPRIAASGIRIYRRWFYLSSGSPLNP